MKKTIINCLVISLIIIWPLACFGGRPFPAMGGLKQGRDYNVYPYTGNKPQPRLPRSTEENSYLDYCSICNGYGEVDVKAEPRLGVAGIYDCPNCRGTGFRKVQGRNVAKYSFPEKVTVDVFKRLALNSEIIEGDITLETSTGEKVVRGHLSVIPQGWGENLEGVMIKWTYKGESNERSYSKEIQRGIGFKLTIIEDREMLFYVELGGYKEGGREAGVHLYQKQFAN